MADFAYPVEAKDIDGEVVISVRDLPEVVTSGVTREEALSLAADAIEVAVCARMDRGRDLAFPSALREGEVAILLPARLAAKAAVYAAWKRSKLTKLEFARRLNRNEGEIRRILNPRHGTKLDQMEEAARALGGRLVISFEAA